ncbi:hypothetical protein X777_11603 [Ooceraea biroi]|uniref:Uncharacterized protein n=1 Tax=Ooceraea biroi TaxID=2015173 RepID=A0A026W2A6_OOCBI|nr:hypothetical protein X777_11603 [Ooceraea biroi]
MRVLLTYARRSYVDFPRYYLYDVASIKKNVFGIYSCTPHVIHKKKLPEQAVARAKNFKIRKLALQSTNPLRSTLNHVTKAAETECVNTELLTLIDAVVVLTAETINDS